MLALPQAMPDGIEGEEHFVKMPPIALEYGDDRGSCEECDFELCERGMTFCSRWQFSLGTQLEVSFSYRSPAGRSSLLTAEGIVVDSKKQGRFTYTVTVLFLDLPELVANALQRGGCTNSVRFAEEWRKRHHG